jgi:hypothetical protein
MACFLADDAPFSYDWAMSQPWDHVPAWAAEFPNDNPALHEGVSWVCLAVCGPAKPVARPRPSSRALGASAVIARGAVHPAGAVLAVVPKVAPVDTASPVDVAEIGPEAAPAAAPCELEALPEVVPVRDGDSTSATPPEERLDFELTPTGGSLSVSSDPLEVLDIDASDLDPDLANSSPPLLITGEGSSEPFVFDGSIDAGASETPMEPPAEEVVGAALGERERLESVAPSEIDVGPVNAAGAAVSPAGAEPEKSAAFRALVAALVEVLLVSGATRAAAVLPGLLEGGADDATHAMALDAESQRSLVAARIAQETDGGLRLAPDFVTTARAWRDVLSGDAHDLSACGTSTLDGWAGDLLKALGVGQDGKTDVRRELRRRGVAAFGMLLAA